MLCPARVKSHQRWRHFPQKSRVCTGVYTERVHKTRMPRGVFRRSFVSVGLLLMSAREQSVEPERMEMRDCHTNNWNNEALRNFQRDIATIVLRYHSHDFSLSTVARNLFNDGGTGSAIMRRTWGFIMT
ncbi:uncharacterized protein LOC107264412 isoform X1 [Cephus cinctus]|uniref:Uncharacterized protein LOC107264412 isoform X1 n=1 Tax=Cephus cinctus TaxID=211228 RepID=A0AAJ7VY29_CEPCN|nr:uncharacterized protein LOC107264412 isoform X1 [Cephus cinctus]